MAEDPKYFELGPDHSELYISPNEVRVYMGLPLPRGWCQNCKKKILVMAFRDKPYCCDDCRKALGKDIK